MIANHLENRIVKMIECSLGLSLGFESVVEFLNKSLDTSKRRAFHNGSYVLVEVGGISGLHIDEFTEFADLLLHSVFTSLLVGEEAEPCSNELFETCEVLWLAVFFSDVYTVSIGVGEEIKACRLERCNDEC